MTLEKKQKKLGEIISRYKGAVVAFSGGVDSTLLAVQTKKQIGDSMVAVTVKAPFIPSHELIEAKELAEEFSIPYAVIEINPIDLEEFNRNHRDRCYHCKTLIFSELKQFALLKGLDAVFEGTNRGDIGDHRPGRKALSELRIVSPLFEAGLDKDDIRALSKEYGLPTASKPSYACLASRVPYGTKITLDNLRRIELAEKVLFDLGFSGHRVRDFFPEARIEVVQDQFRKVSGSNCRKEIVGALKNLGYTVVTIDLQGYRTGSLNEPS